MIEPLDLLKFALEICSGRVSAADEAWDRRAVSASYYALFHRLCQASAQSFKNAGPTVEAQVSRAYAHTEMKKVCQHFVKPALPAPLDALISSPVDSRLRDIANAFIKLQQARHLADYNFAAAVTRQDALDASRLSYQAFEAFAAIKTDRNTAVFLTALLLGDRWNK